MNLDLDPGQRRLAATVLAASASAAATASGWDVLQAAGISELLAVGSTAPGLFEWCLMLEELGSDCRDLTRVRSALPDAVPGRQDAEAVADRDVLACAAYAVGVGRRCLELAQERASERVVAGRRLIERQGVSHQLARVAVELALARVGLWRAAATEDEGEPAGYHAPDAAAACVSAALSGADAVVQVFGAAGTSDPDVVRLHQTAYQLPSLCGSPASLRRQAGSRWLALAAVTEKVASPTIPEAGARRWILRPVPREATAVLLCFPYAGVGASSYRDWPRTIAGMHVAALQPPGRENRMKEPKPATHQDFARSLSEALPLLAGRPFGFFGHCGAVPYMLETAFHLQAEDRPLPQWIIASSWGPPQDGLYGALNFVDLATHDFRAEVVTMAAGMGLAISPELVELAADLLRFDQTVQRAYRYPVGRKIPVPVAVVGWSADDIVPPELATAPAWEEVATTRALVLEGVHGEYLKCPDQLQRLVADLRTTWSRSEG